MSTEDPNAQPDTGRFDRGYTFSFAVAVGLILFIAGLVISLTLGEGTSLGLIFGIPLIIAGMVLPLIMMRDQFKTNVISDNCPYCGNTIRTTDATLSLQCPNCQNVVMVHDMKFQRRENTAAGQENKQM